jgi:hypothetical protein
MNDTELKISNMKTDQCTQCVCTLSHTETEMFWKNGNDESRSSLSAYGGLGGLQLAWVTGSSRRRLGVADLTLSAEHGVAVVVPAGRLSLHTLDRGRV